VHRNGIETNPAGTSLHQASCKEYTAEKDMLGKGSFGKVFRGRRGRTVVALKHFAQNKVDCAKEDFQSKQGCLSTGFASPAVWVKIPLARD
jgi:hypothetical protein